MYGKVHLSLWDGSLGGSWEGWSVFVFMLAAADREGVVVMTADGIARRTSMPLEAVQRGLAVLEAPDPASRTPDEDGRRIVRLDPERPAGWRIVNYSRYRLIATTEDKRRVWRDSKARSRAAQVEMDMGGPQVEPGGPKVDFPPVPTREMQRQREKQEPTPSSLRSEGAPERRHVGLRIRLLDAGDGPPSPERVAGGPEDQPPTVGLPCSSGADIWPTEAAVAEWQGLYPGVDILGQLRAMRGWLLSHPNRRKTPRGVRAFVSTWLAKEQNRGGRAEPAKAGIRSRVDREYVEDNLR